MGLNFGNAAISGAYLGSSMLSAAYLGGHLLWQLHRDPVMLMRQPFSPGDEAGKFPQNKAFPLYESNRFNNYETFAIELKNEADELILSKRCFTLEFWLNINDSYQLYNLSNDGILGPPLNSKNVFNDDFYIYFDKNNGGTVYRMIRFGSSFRRAFHLNYDNKWHHWAIVCNGRDIAIFIDGIRIPDYYISGWDMIGSGQYISRIRLTARLLMANTCSFDIIMLLDEIAVFDYERYLADFTPPTEPYSLTTSIQE